MSANPYRGVGGVMGNVNMLAGSLQGQIAAQEDRRKQAQVAFENQFQMANFAQQQANQAQQQANFNLTRGDRLQDQATDKAWREKMFGVEQDRWNTNRGDTLTNRADEQAWRAKMFKNTQDQFGNTFGLQKDEFAWRQKQADENNQLKKDLAEMKNLGKPSGMKVDSPADVNAVTGWQREYQNNPYSASGRDAAASLRTAGQPMPFARLPENQSFGKWGSAAVIGATAVLAPFMWASDKIAKGIDRNTTGFGDVLGAGINKDNLAFEREQLNMFINDIPKDANGAPIAKSPQEEAKILQAYTRRAQLQDLYDSHFANPLEASASAMERAGLLNKSQVRSWTGGR
jgi:hypothetical protein